MRAKKTKARTPARPIRYLLSANWGQHRISLKRVSQRITKARKAARSSGGTRARARTRARRETTTIGSRTVLLATIVAVVGTAALIARQSSSGADGTAAVEAASTAPESIPGLESGDRSSMRPETETAQSHLRDRALPVEAARKPPARPVPVRSVEPAGRYEAAPAAAPMPRPLETTREPSESPALADVPSGAVTIEGCVVREDDGFWLKDTSGEAAPKSRTWKSGFLKKRSESIYLVDARGGVNLDSYVGRRVAATGTLADREMRPRSVRQVAAVCD